MTLNIINISFIMEGINNKYLLYINFKIFICIDYNFIYINSYIGFLIRF